MSICGFILSLFAGVYLTADAVSSEKRDGTLGLLFLTPLNGSQIIFGKMFTHSLQVTYALLAGFPLFFLPILLGGVLWHEVARILLVLLVTLLLSLACGICWSTISTEARTAVLATTVSMILLTLLPWLWIFIQEMISRRSQLLGLPQVTPLTALFAAFETNYRRSGAPGFKGTSGSVVFWGSMGCNLGWIAMLLVLSGWLLPRLWRRAEAGAHRPEPLPPTGAAPAFKATPARAPLSGQDPLLWLAARGLREALWLRWVRGVALVFFAAMLVSSVATRHWEEAFISAFCTAYGLHLVTRIQLALAATRCLHEDRRSGALEALLTTPVPSADVVRAHHLSLRQAFLRPLLVLLAMNGLLQLAVVCFPRHLRMNNGAGAVFTTFFLGGAAVTLADFAALRWLGLCESLRSPTQLRAAGRALGFLVGAVWPGFAVALLVAISLRREAQGAVAFGVWFAGCLLYDWLIICFCQRWLRPGLRRRVSEG